jgi:hypothetical protein
MAQLPVLINLLFIVATIFCIWQFFLAKRRSGRFLGIIILLLLIEAVLALKGFYSAAGFPPRFLFAIVPVIFSILIGALIIRKPATFNLQHLLLLNVVRIPVEVCLVYACHAKLVPQEMTFEGLNFDILSGVSSLLLYYFVFIKKVAGRKTLITWNIVSLLLLLNVLIIAVLSAPTPFQRIAFDQPNRLIALFPFIWLPGIIVPLVLLSHIISLRQLLSKNKFVA